jgi:hypothetical protein
LIAENSSSTLSSGGRVDMIHTTQHNTTQHNRREEKEQIELIKLILMILIEIIFD